ncbi:cytochrome P450 monooxygenase pc-bph [Mucidula mucida]|nr:cytochrome P450 monooxygenase pc-bph [Mucidula mucida]
MVLDHLSLSTILASSALVVVLLHLIPYLVDRYKLRAFPGPLGAKFSDAWLGVVSYHGHRSEVVHQLHLKHGPFVRLAPNHISIASPDALPVVYGHGNGTLKSGFYDAFVSIQRGLFNTRDRQDHSRKRKIVAHIFAQKSVLEFEPRIRVFIGQLVGQWERLCDLAAGGKETMGTEGEGWVARNDWVWLDCLPWVNYLAFDIVGDLAFGAPFGMLRAGKDSAPVPQSNEEAMKCYGDSSTSASDVREIPAVQILNGRGEYSMTMGVFPSWWRPIMAKTPWFSQGKEDVKTLAGIAIMAVSKRLAAPTDRNDLLSKLQAGKDEHGNPMGREELTAEALTLLIAGSDTTSNSTCAILHYLSNNRAAHLKLQAELDEHLAPNDIATSDEVKALPYLQACINEGLRLHSTSALGLPRVVPEGGMTVLGAFFPAGTVVSVPSYTIHRDEEIWGADVEAFRPERWFDEERKDRMARTFNPFSVGPRACVGRNLAMMELQMIVATLVKRFDFIPEVPGVPLDVREGFLRKPLTFRMGIKKRDVV